MRRSFSWHVVQQKQGRVRPLRQVQGTSINDDLALETEADTMGTRSLHAPETAQAPQVRHTGRFLSSTSAVIQPKVGFELEVRIPVWKEGAEEFASKAPLGTIESPVEDLKPSDLVVDTNHEMAEKYKAALEKGNVGDPKPGKYEKGRIVEIVTPAIDEFDPLAEKKMDALIHNLAKEALGWEKSIKSGHIQRISPPFLPGVITGFETKDEALKEFMGATAFIQATVGSRIEAFGNLAGVARKFLNPEHVRPERVGRAKTLQANLPTSEEHARTILQRLQTVHEQKQTSSPQQQEKKVKEEEHGFSLVGSAQEKKPPQTGFSLEEGTPEKSQSGFTSGGFTSGFTFGSPTLEKPEGGFTFGGSTSGPIFGSATGGVTSGGFTGGFTLGSPTLEKPQGGFTFGGPMNVGGGFLGASSVSLPMDLRVLRDLQGFFQLISLQLLGGKGKEVGQLKNLTPLLNKSGLHIIRQQTLSKDAQTAIAVYSKELIDIIAQINGVDLDADVIESKDGSPIVKQYLEAILTGDNDPLFNYITMRNMEKEIAPEEVGPPQKRTLAPVLEFRNITEKIHADKWVPFTLGLLGEIRKINSGE